MLHFKRPQLLIYFRYNIEAGEFDQGIGCIIRGQSGHFQESSVQCTLITQLESSFLFEKNEELVSNIVKLTRAQDGQEISVCKIYNFLGKLF